MVKAKRKRERAISNIDGERKRKSCVKLKLRLQDINGASRANRENRARISTAKIKS